MIEGSGSKDFAKVKKLAYAHPESFKLPIDLLIEAVVDHLGHQVDAGVAAVQLFLNWVQPGVGNMAVGGYTAARGRQQ